MPPKPTLPPDEELRVEWVLAYFSTRAWLGRRERIGVDTERVPLLHLKPAFAYQAGVATINGHPQRFRNLEAIEMMPSLQRVALPLANTAIVSLADASDEDLKNVKDLLTSAMSANIRNLDGPSRIAIPGRQ